MIDSALVSRLVDESNVSVESDVCSTTMNSVEPQPTSSLGRSAIRSTSLRPLRKVPLEESRSRRNHLSPSGVNSACLLLTVGSVIGSDSDERPMSCGSPCGKGYTHPRSGPSITSSTNIPTIVPAPCKMHQMWMEGLCLRGQFGSLTL